MNDRDRRVSPLVAGFIAGIGIALVIALMAAINVNFGAPWAKTHTVTAQVSDADGIAMGSDVRIAGRLVGQVTAVDAKGDHTDVTFKVDDSDWPLPADTSASIRLATLLGQKYIQLEPGHDQSHELADNGVIGLQATKPVVDFDQILNTFDKPTRDSLTALIRTAGAAVQGQEGNLQQLVPTMRDLSVNSVVSTGELSNHDSDINAILQNLATTTNALDQSRQDLAGVIDSMNSITGALAQNQGAALRAYIRNVDTINRTTNAVLGGDSASQLEAGLAELGPFVDKLDTLVTHIYPQTAAALNGGFDRAGIDLVYEIGDATSQSDTSGFFLRQSAAGVDICGLTPVCNPAPQAPAAAAPQLPKLPITLPKVNVPPLPQSLCATVSQLVPVPGCPPPSGGTSVTQLPPGVSPSPLPAAECQQLQQLLPPGSIIPGCPTPTPGAAPAPLVPNIGTSTTTTGAYYGQRPDGIGDNGGDPAYLETW